MTSAPSHYDPRIPPRDVCVTRYALERWAREQPDMPYMVFEDGSCWTYRELKARVEQLAAGLAGLGVGQGDHVAVWLPNNRECVLTFHALNWLGAVFVPFNTAYRGRLLEHVVGLSDARVIVVHAELAGRLAEVDLAQLSAAVIVGGVAEAVPGLAMHAFADIANAAGEAPPLARPIEPWDNQSIIFTSGTTGPSKGVLSSYCHMYSNAGPESWPFITGEDRFLLNMPMFHIGGMGIAFVMLVRGGSVALMEQFSTEGFWPFVRATGTTAMFMLGAVATFLMRQPPGADDRNHPVKKAFMVPLTDDADGFRERFGVEIYTIFNMTEISSPIVSQPNPSVRGTCGKMRAGVEVRLVDENDCEVPVGEVGEMIIRTERPWGMNSGYHKNPEATARAWRNGWFHTGDAFRRDEQGYFYFVDRMKDAIRRRGENISSFEVELEVLAHPAVLEAAAMGVPSAYSEDEVLVAVAPREGASIDPEELVRFLIDRMPYFMVPRYVRIMESLPKTPTAKVQKHLLRDDGVTADTFDREAAGIRVKSERLARS
ncbi:MAG: AMP-binding protein [Erythrobacter sp.]